MSVLCKAYNIHRDDSSIVTRNILSYSDRGVEIEIHRERGSNEIERERQKGGERERG